MNSAYERVTGHSKEEWRNPVAVLQQMYGDRLAGVRQAHARAKEEGFKEALQFEIRRKDGKQRWIRSTGFEHVDGAVRGGGGEGSMMVAGGRVVARAASGGSRQHGWLSLTTLWLLTHG